MVSALASRNSGPIPHDFSPRAVSEREGGALRAAKAVPGDDPPTRNSIASTPPPGTNDAPAFELSVRVLNFG
jgi:hypothetical protein